jgi:hypothetical protein
VHTYAIAKMHVDIYTGMPISMRRVHIMTAAEIPSVAGIHMRHRSMRCRRRRPGMLAATVVALTAMVRVLMIVAIGVVVIVGVATLRIALITIMVSARMFRRSSLLMMILISGSVGLLVMSGPGAARQTSREQQARAHEKRLGDQHMDLRLLVLSLCT